MKSPLFAALSALLLLLLAWATWPDATLPETPPPHPPAVRSEAAVAIEASATTPELRSAPESQAAARRQPAAPPPAAAPVAERFLAGIRGTLLLPDRTPATGFQVALFEVEPIAALTGGDLSSHSEPSLRVAPSRTKSAGDGSFRITGIDPRASLVLQAGAGSDHPTSLRLDRAPKAGEVLELGEVVLSDARVATGRVVDPDGRPVAGAWVRSLKFDDHGPAGDLFRDLRLDLFDPAGFVAVDRGRGGLQVLALPPWVKTLYDDLGIAEAFTGTDGSFRLAGLAPQRNWVTAAKHGSFMPAFKAGVAAGPGEKNLGNLVLGRGETIRGRVLDADERPVARAEVLVGPTSFNDNPAHVLAAVGRTDAEGRFSLGGLPPREIIVAVRPERAPGWSASGPHPHDREVLVKLPAKRKLTVVLAGEAGAEAVGVELRLFGGRAAGELLALGFAKPLAVRWTHQGRGTWSTDGLDPGEYTLVTTARAWAGHAFFLLEKDHTVEVALEPAASLSVEVVDTSGTPIVGASVHAQPQSPRGWLATNLPANLGIPHWQILPAASARTDASGRAVLAALPAGLVQVQAFHPGYSTGHETVSVPAGPVRITLADRGLLAGQVLNGGKPQPAPRSILIESVVGTGLFGDPPVMDRLVRTDATGSFSVGELSAGDYTASVQREQPSPSSSFGILHALLAARPGGRQVSRRFTIEPGRTTRIWLEEQSSLAAPDEPRLTVSGLVTVDGAPGKGLEVGVQSWDARAGPGSYPKVKTMVGEDGTFRIEGVRAPRATGKVTLWLTRLNAPFVRNSERPFCLHTTTAAIMPDQMELRFDVALETGDLAGVVLDEQGKPVKCAVEINGKSFAGQSAFLGVESDAQGRFAVDGLPTGTYDFQTFAAKGNSNTKDVRIVRGPNTARLVMLGYCTVSGTVDLTGIAAPGDLAVTVVLVFRDGPINWRPMGAVDKSSGRFAIPQVRADEYEVFVACDGKWWRHPETVHVAAGRSEGLWITPVASAGPQTLGPPPPRKERKGGGMMSGGEATGPDGEKLRPKK